MELMAVRLYTNCVQLLYLSRPMPLRKVVKLVVPQAVQDAQRQTLRESIELPLHACKRPLGVAVLQPVAPVDHITQLQSKPEGNSDSNRSSLPHIGKPVEAHSCIQDDRDYP